jgi:hypothetical protein
MRMSAERVVDLCERSLQAMREDMWLFESGAVNLHSYANVDANGQILARMSAVVSNLQAIIDGWGSDCDCDCDCTQ